MGGGKWFRAFAVALVLTATTASCGSDAADVAATSSPTAAPSNEPTTDGPTAEMVDSPTAEGTGLESPQPKLTRKVVVHLAGPQVSGQGGDYSVDQPAGCAVFQIVPELNEDVVVRAVSITPRRGFVQDDSGCEQTTCPGFVYPKGESSTCQLGIRWKPDSGVSTGTAALTLRGLCRDREDELCQQLEKPPPPTGVTVQFQIAMRLQPTLPEPSSDESPSDEPPSDEPTTGESPASFAR